MPIRLISLIAIIEGAIIIACELGFGHLITPYYGTSLQVWSTSIVTAMLAMGLGYLTSTIINEQTDIKRLLVIYSIYSLIVAFIAVFQKEIILFTLQFDFSIGLILVSFIFIFVSIYLFSILLPVLINHQSKNAIDTGYHTGHIYFYSTISSIAISILFGFFLFEILGVEASIILLAICSAFSLFILYVVHHKLNLILLGALSITTISILSLKQNHEVSGEVYRSEGLMGELIVQDFGTGNDMGRRLFLNGSIQTMIYKSNGNSYGHYPYLIRSLLKKINIKDGKALLLGLGGGTIANELVKQNYEVTAVELDPRISKVATKYFYPNLKFTSIVKDGRFYINQSNELYDCIILDVFTSENPPYHLLTKESFKKINNLLKEKGVLLINFNGFWTGKSGFANKSILKTLLDIGYKVNIYPTDQQEDQRNAIYLATKNTQYGNESIYYMNNNISTPIKFSEYDLTYVDILEDDKPLLPLLNLEAANTWRKYGIEFLKSEQFDK